MSFKSNPFDRFSHLDPESRLNQFRKRFDHLSHNPNMFGEPNLTNRWPPTSNCMPTNDPEEGIPIKVIHEKSDHQSNAEPNDKSSDTMSSFGSSQSQRSGETSHSSGTSHRSFNSNRSHHSSDSGSSQPRVHHIPIQVEPRDGSSSSGYASEANVAAEQPLSRSSSHSSAHSMGNVANVRPRSRTESPVSTTNKSDNSSEEKGRVRKIPIQVESKEVRSSASPVNESPIKAKKVSDQTQTKPKSGPNGPFVTRIPVVNQTNSEQQKSEDNTEDNKEDKSDSKMNPMQEIEKILNDLRNYENEVKQFDGKLNDKKYRYLDEMLTRCMIKLDTIETNGDEEVRKARKAAVMAVNQCILLLEQKVSEANQSKTRQNDPKQPKQETNGNEEEMQTSTSESDSKQNINEPMAIDDPQNTDNNGQQKATENKPNDNKTEANKLNNDQNQSTTNNSNGSHPKETAV